jgi:hypothetical protein
MSTLAKAPQKNLKYYQNKILLAGIRTGAYERAMFLVVSFSTNPQNHKLHIIHGSPHLMHLGKTTG